MSEVSATAATSQRTTSRSAANPLREVGIFALLTAALTTLSMGTAAQQGADIEHLGDATVLAQVALFGTAFIPVIAAVVARWVAAGTLTNAGWGWKRTSLASVGAGWVLSVVIVVGSASVVWLSGVGSFDSAALEDEMGMPWAIALAVALTLGAAPFVVLALGEELAWRGTILMRLAELSSPRMAALATGVLWSAFHFPLMIFVDGAVVGAPVVWAMLCFSVSNIALSFPLAALRFRTRSVWPVVFSHAVFNSLLIMFTDPATGDEGKTEWFAGEVGLFIALTSIVVAVASSRWTLLRVPDEDEMVEGAA